MQRGDPVLVHLPDGRLIEAKVQKVFGREVRVRWVEALYVNTTRSPYILVDKRRTYTVRRNEEGITWARGWVDTAADALRAAVALA